MSRLTSAVSYPAITTSTNPSAISTSQCANWAAMPFWTVRSSASMRLAVRSFTTCCDTGARRRFTHSTFSGLRGRPHRLCRAARRGRILNTSAAAPLMCSAPWSRRPENTLPSPRRIARAAISRDESLLKRKEILQRVAVGHSRILAIIRGVPGRPDLPK